MSESLNRLIFSLSPDDDKGLGLLDGKVKLDVERVRVGPISPEEIQKAELTLSAACALYEIGDHTTAYAFAVRASLELFQAVKTPDEAVAPLKVLFRSLVDVFDRKVADPALSPSVRMKGESTSEWCARACLASAMEARVRRGEQLKSAAAGVRTQVHIDPKRKPTDRVGSEKVLTEWRAQFQKGKAPAGGPIWDASKEVFDGLSARSPAAETLGQLSSAERILIQKAQDFRSRVLR